MFSSFVGSVSLVEAEVRAIQKACQPCVSDRCPANANVIIESDSMVVVSWVNGIGGTGNVRVLEYILDIKEILHLCKPRLTVKYVPRGKNVAADFLAKQGALYGRVQEAWTLE